MQVQIKKTLKQLEESDKLSTEGTGAMEKTYGRTEENISENRDIVEGLG
jgi:hypothetical protein